MSQDYTGEEKKELLELARTTIEKYLKNQEKEYPPTDNPRFMEKRGVFVTLHKEGDLRGCIGYPLPVKPLFEAIVDNAVSAATEDYRFNPVAPGELKEIDIEISVLTVPEAAASYKDVVVGRDGIIIGKGFNKGLLLPQVPVEQGWNLEEYISYGCMKAGLSSDEWKRPGKSIVSIETFQAIVFGEKE
jgi:AmmeMemoRadiSam system protein A